MTEQELQAIERWAVAAKDHGGCGMTCSGVDDLLTLCKEARRLQAELARYEAQAGCAMVFTKGG